MQRFVVGAELRLAPLLLPQAPLTINDAVQELSVVPVFAPWQLQVHGPEPLTADGVPELHKPAAGADKKSPLFDDPQAPLTINAAAQELEVPVFAPWQVQLHGPLPPIADGVPELHKPAAGADKKSPLFDDPQTPLTINNAPQESVVPELAP